MKRTFTFLLALMLFVAANAQSVTNERLYSNPIADKPSIVAAPSMATITPTSGQIWWANYDVTASTQYIEGTQKAEHYNVATYIPADLMPGAGRTIDGFSFFPISTKMKNVKVWIATKLPTYGSDADLETVSVSSVTNSAFNDVAFATKHSIPAGGLYVGYSFDISSATTSYDKRPIVYTDSDINRQDACCYNSASSKSWKKHNHNLYAKVLFGGGNYPANSATLTSTSFGSAVVLKGDTKNISINVQNTGTTAISSFTYTISTDGAVTQEATVNVSISKFQDVKTVTIPFKSDGDAKKYSKVFTITKVNGVANQSSMNTMSGLLYTVTTTPEHIAVVEEFTGTWCGYCPYGFVGMEKAKEQYGDKAALIAVHNGNGGYEVMEISDYTPVVNAYVSGFPSAIFNREYTEHAYYVPDVLSQIINDPTLASISGTAMWSSTDKTAVNFATQTKFVYSDNNGQFAIAFVLVEDGLKGSGSDWAQSNYLSGDSSAGSDMTFWINSGSKVSGLEYDHVAVAAWDVLNGIDGSVKTSFAADEVMNFSYTATLTSQSLSLIQDKSKLQAFALLIDRTSGHIINAARINIQDYVAGIMDISRDNTTVTGYYTADGRQLQAPAKGVNIVKYSDGTTRKVVVK